jgi:hypothetical protein
VVVSRSVISFCFLISSSQLEEQEGDIRFTIKLRWGVVETSI